MKYQGIAQSHTNDPHRTFITLFVQFSRSPLSGSAPAPFSALFDDARLPEFQPLDAHGICNSARTRSFAAHSRGVLPALKRALFPRPPLLLPYLNPLPTVLK
jgi:hypothetical protein